MKTTRVSGALAAGILGSAFMLAGCSNDDSSGDDGDDTYDIAVVLKTLSSPYWLQVAGGVEAAEEETGTNVTLAGATEETEVQEQVDKVRSAITQQVDALVVAPTEAEQLQPILEDAVEQDIPVLLVDTDIEDWDEKETFIGTDNYSAGETGGEFIADEVDGGEIGFIRGVPGNPSIDDRIDGAMETLEGSDFENVADLSADSDRAEARSVMADMLQSNPDLSALFAGNDDMALGAIEAIKGADMDTDDVFVVGVDGTEDAVDSLLAGELDATIAQNSYEMGKTSVETAVALLDGEEIDERIDTGVTVVTPDNAEEYGDELEEHAAEEDIADEDE